MIHAGGYCSINDDGDYLLFVVVLGEWSVLVKVDELCAR
jgi:hypothetical protein